MSDQNVRRAVRRQANMQEQARQAAAEVRERREREARERAEAERQITPATPPPAQTETGTEKSGEVPKEGGA